jgi:hypothetical protein
MSLTYNLGFKEFYSKEKSQIITPYISVPPPHVCGAGCGNSLVVRNVATETKETELFLFALKSCIADL